MENYRAYSDQKLIVLLKDGDASAFREIYNRYWAAMYAHVVKMTGSHADAQDILQDLFSALWLKAGELNPKTRLSGFLYISARNRVFNLFQKQKLRQDHKASLAQFIDTVSPDSLEALTERDLRAAIETEIARLPPRMRQVFELSRKQHLSHKQIARQLNISDQTVRKQIQHALRILRPRLSLLRAGLFILLTLQ